MCINSFRKFQHKKTKIKQKQNFSGETSFFQHKSNSSCKHITDNKMQVYYRECHLSCIRFFHRLFIHFENHTHLSLLSIYASIILFKLSVLERFLPFNFFLLLKTLRLSEFLSNFPIMGRRLFSVLDLSDEYGVFSSELVFVYLV